MLFRAPVVVLAALFAGSVLATNKCPAGTYKQNGNSGYQCITCPEGQYTSVDNQWNSCFKCDAGKTSTPDHKGCTRCTGETYSNKGTACMTCPAGQERNDNRTGCNKCCEGEFNPTPGGRCSKCPLGTFTSVEGSKSCCECCAGFYPDTPGSKSCKQCSNEKKCGPSRSTSGNYCQPVQQLQSRGPRSDYMNSCHMTGKTCPPTTPGGPVGSPIARKRSEAACANGLTSCPRYSGQGGFDCLDTQSDAESCGGCVGAEGEGSGTDCTAVDGVNATRCVKGSCVVDSCRKGWVKSIDGTSCAPAGSSESDVLYDQETDAKKLKRSSAKRSIRHTMF